MSFTISYPHDSSATDTLDLPNPDLGDSDTLRVKTRFKYAMSGRIYSFVETPATRRALWVFNTISDCSDYSTYTEIVTFLKAYAGYQLKIEDHFGNTWTGIIMNNPKEVIARNQEFYTITLEFEGTVT